jgi:hypothetical protein
LRGFKADGKTINYLPKGIGKCCTEMEVLVIKASKLKDITSDNLRDFPNLVHLDLSYNEIRILERDLFQNNSKLVNIHLNNNKIFVIFPTVFDGQKGLKKLYLKNNACRPNSDDTNEQIQEIKGNEICFKNVNDDVLTTTRNIIKVERIEANARYYFENPDVLNTTHLNLARDMKAVQEEIKFLKDLYSKSVSDLKNSIERIKRDVYGNNTIIFSKIEELKLLMNENVINQKYNHDNLTKQNNNLLTQIGKINDLNNTVNAISSEISDLKADTISIDGKIRGLNSLINILTTKSDDIISKSDVTNQNLANINENHRKILNEIDKLKKESNKLSENQGSSHSVIIGYINTILLIIIASVLLYLTFHDKKQSITKVQPTKMSSPTDSVNNTAVTQLSDDSLPVEIRNIIYEPLDTNDTYETLPNNDTQNNVKRATTFIPNDVAGYECHGFNNDVYGTAIDEDLYSEVISPRRAMSKENVDADIYAVVYKPQRD